MGNRQTGMGLMYRVIFHTDSSVAVVLVDNCRVVC